MGTAKEVIEQGRASLGIEFGSTRIKAVLIDEENSPVASGSWQWENRYEDGIWTYSTDDIWGGLQGCFRQLQSNVKEKYDMQITKLKALGISGMMHGYLVFDKEGKLLVPFRTWRNTITGQAADILTRELNFNIPERWSIAHLYQAVLNDEPHVKNIAFMTTLAGYVHWKLTGEKVVGIGEASGIFPVDSVTKNYRSGFLEKCSRLFEKNNYMWKLEDILPRVLAAGENAGTLSSEGALLIDPEGNLLAGVPLCPPEGDAGTGMTATNSIESHTGNVSAGTSIFAMAVLKEDLKKVHTEIDMVTTPDGNPVAMVHCNNCTSDLNAWISLFKEFAGLAGAEISENELYEKLFKKALEGRSDCGGILSFNYYAGEPVAGFEKGSPVIARDVRVPFTLADFMRTQITTILATLKLGMDILQKEEGVKLDKLYGHGGLFKTKAVMQKIMAAAFDTPVEVMETAGEGGAWGIALLASYMAELNDNKNRCSLQEFLQEKVFNDCKSSIMKPDREDTEGFEKYMERFVKGFSVERAAADVLSF